MKDSKKSGLVVVNFGYARNLKGYKKSKVLDILHTCKWCVSTKRLGTTGLVLIIAVISNTNIFTWMSNVLDPKPEEAKSKPIPFLK